MISSANVTEGLVRNLSQNLPKAWGTLLEQSLHTPSCIVKAITERLESGNGSGIRIRQIIQVAKYDWHQYASSLLSAFLARCMKIYAALLRKGMSIKNTVKSNLIRISRLSWLFLWSQFCHECLLVTNKIRSHILYKTTALKSAVKCEGFLLSKSKAALVRVVTNEKHSNEFWLAQSCVVEISRSMACSALYGKQRSSCLQSASVVIFLLS